MGISRPVQDQTQRPLGCSGGSGERIPPQMIPVTCDPEGKLDRVSLDEIEEFQGGLKSLGKTEYSKLKQSITEKGFVVPCFAWRNGSGKWKLLDGHQRVRVIRTEGWTIDGGIPVVEIVAENERDAKEKLLAIVSRYGRVEGQGLYEFLDGTGIDLEEWTVPDLPDLDLDSWLDEFIRDPEVPPGDPEAVPEVPEEATTQRGDLWVLGDHRVLCGDATSVDDVEKLMGGEVARYGLHDPPYGIDVVKSERVGNSKPFGSGTYSATMGVVKRGEYQKIKGDDAPFSPSHLFALSESLILWGANYYADKLPSQKGWIVWDKKCRDEWRDNYSDCELAWSNLPIVTRIIRHTWLGMVQEGERETRVHPTQKPSEMLAKIIDEFFVEDGIILDCYLGSGATLIAAEKQGRRCSGMEIEPKYVDVIVKRWEDYTGKTAVLEQSEAA